VNTSHRYYYRALITSRVSLKLCSKDIRCRHPRTSLIRWLLTFQILPFKVIIISGLTIKGEPIVSLLNLSNSPIAPIIKSGMTIKGRGILGSILCSVSNTALKVGIVSLQTTKSYKQKLCLED